MTEPEPPLVRIVIYIHGGICHEVKTNLPDDSWEYSVVDFDNEPDLPDGHVPYTKVEMAALPSLTVFSDLIDAAQQVIDNWESSNLAAVVRQMAEILTTIKK